LTNLNFPENDNMDLFLFIRGFRHRKRGLAWEQRKQADNWACEIVGFAWMQFLIPFFWQQNGSKMKGFKLDFRRLGSRTLPKQAAKGLKAIRWCQGSPLGKLFQTPFWGFKIFLKGPLLVLEDMRIVQTCDVFRCVGLWARCVASCFRLCCLHREPWLQDCHQKHVLKEMSWCFIGGLQPQGLRDWILNKYNKTYMTYTLCNNNIRNNSIDWKTHI